MNKELAIDPFPCTKGEKITKVIFKLKKEER